MTLIVDTLDGTIDRVAVAIERLQAFAPDEGYYVAFSGTNTSTSLAVTRFTAGS